MRLFQVEGGQQTVQVDCESLQSGTTAVAKYVFTPCKRTTAVAKYVFTSCSNAKELQLLPSMFLCVANFVSEGVFIFHLSPVCTGL